MGLTLPENCATMRVQGGGIGGAAAQPPLAYLHQILAQCLGSVFYKPAHEQNKISFVQHCSLQCLSSAYLFSTVPIHCRRAALSALHRSNACSSPRMYRTSSELTRNSGSAGSGQCSSSATGGACTSMLAQPKADRLRHRTISPFLSLCQRLLIECIMMLFLLCKGLCSP